MTLQHLFEEYSGLPKSVSDVLTVDEKGEAYTHRIEPELAGASIPRVARLTEDTLLTRRGFWNVSLVIAGLVSYCARGMYGDPFWAVYGGGVFAVLAGAILLYIRKQNDDLRFLREGVAVHGLLRSGNVDDFGNNGRRYYLHYTYWTGAKTERNTIAVDETEYIKRVIGNPYFTVLYDARNPRRSVPYHRITAAHLAAKEIGGV